MMLNVTQIQNILPHRYPFLLIDRVVEIKKNESLIGYKNITINESVFQGHFPNHPIYPGVMIIEGMARAGGLLAFESIEDKESVKDKVIYFMSIDKAKFRSPVTPGDRLEYRVNVIKSKGNVWVLNGKSYVDDKLVAQAEFKAMLMDR